MFNQYDFNQVSFNSVEIYSIGKVDISVTVGTVLTITPTTYPILNIDVEVS